MAALLDEACSRPGVNAAVARPAPRGVRWPEVDLLKAAAILAVVMVHSINDRIAAYEGGLETLLGHLTRFAVPAFLFAAGFLFDKGTTPALTVLRKAFRRLVPPYLVCSIAILGYEALRSAPLTPRAVVGRLVLGETSGIYYFIFVLGYLYVLALGLRRCPRWLVAALWVAEVAAFVWFYLAWPAFLIPTDPGRFWRVLLRNPIIHLLPYLSGWLVGLHYDRIRPILARHGLMLAAALLAGDVALLALLQVVPSDAAVHGRELIVALHTAVAVCGLLCVGAARPCRWQAVVWLSECSYGIYLVHLVFVQAMHRRFRPAWEELYPERILVTWLASLLGSVAVLLIARRLFGRTSRDLLGA